MIAVEHYLRRVRDLLSSVAAILTHDEQAEVSYLVDHGEPAEALRTLAWIIVEEDKRVPAAALAAIKDLTAGLVDEKDLPDRLDDFAAR
jgi:hypothetical protein